MKILLLSDLHHELWRDNAPAIDPSLSIPDVVVLAGDINTGAKAVAFVVDLVERSFTMRLNAS